MHHPPVITINLVGIKLPFFWNGNQSTYKNGDDWGMVEAAPGLMGQKTKRYPAWYSHTYIANWNMAITNSFRFPIKHDDFPQLL